MNFEDERYVRVYTRDTTDLVALSWEARAVWWEFLRKADRAGVIDVGKAGVRGLAGLLRIPFEVVERALPELLADGSVVIGDGSYVAPNFAKAQECRQSDRARQAASREGRRIRAMSQNVTESHQPSPAVTDCHSVPSRAVPCSAVLGGAGGPEPGPLPDATSVPPEGTPPAPPVPRKAKPPKPDMGPEVEAAWSAYLDGAKRANKTRIRTEASTKRIQRAIATYGPDLVTAACAGIWHDDFARRTGKDDLEWTLREQNIQRHADLGRKVRPIAQPPPKPIDPNAEDPVEAMMRAERAKRWGTTG